MRANYMLYKDFFLHVHTIYSLFYFLAVLGLLCCMQAFSSCGKQGLLSSRDAQTSNCGGFCYGAQALGAWASVVAAHGPQRVGSVVVVHGLSCSTTCEIFLDQGSNLFSPVLAVRIPSTVPPGKSIIRVFDCGEVVPLTPTLSKGQLYIFLSRSKQLYIINELAVGFI